MMKGRMLVAAMAMWGMAAHAEVGGADDATPAPAGNTYLAVEALQNSVKSSNVNTGFGGAVQLGVHLNNPRLSLEGDFRYRRDDYHTFPGTSTRKSANGVLRYEFTDNELWRPYLSLGVGVVKARQVFDYGTNAEGTIALGLVYNVAPAWQVRAEVMHMRIFHGHDSNEDMVALGLQYNFNIWLPRPGPQQ